MAEEKAFGWRFLSSERIPYKSILTQCEIDAIEAYVPLDVSKIYRLEFKETGKLKTEKIYVANHTEFGTPPHISAEENYILGDVLILEDNLFAYLQEQVREALANKKRSALETIISNFRDIKERLTKRKKLEFSPFETPVMSA